MRSGVFTGAKNDARAVYRQARYEREREREREGKGAATMVMEESHTMGRSELKIETHRSCRGRGANRSILHNALHRLHRHIASECSVISRSCLFAKGALLEDEVS